MSDIKFTDLGLAEPIQRALSARNHTIPTDIQARAIPPLLAGRDILGLSQTGTGKTGAFALPILQSLFAGRPQRAPKRPLALVLAPTRELAIQIADEFRAYAAGMSLRQTSVFGGVGQGPQVKGLARGVDLVVATPGRLVDLMMQGHVHLDDVRHFVLDEADRMLDMGFARDIRKIVDKLPAERQSLLFSATMPKDIALLAGDLLNDPVRIEVVPQGTPISRIAQQVHHVESAGKIALLSDLVKAREVGQAIVFVRTKHRANRVAEQLGRFDIDAEAIHGNKSQTARQRTLKRFRSGQLLVLVATDIAARGIDVDGISHVFNFELPNEPESYVHRIGRTARAGATGTAVSLCDRSELTYLRDIEKLIGARIEAFGDVPAEQERRESQPKRRNGWKKKAPPAAANDTGGPRRSRHRRRKAA